jgi:antitoxin PrlF
MGIAYSKVTSKSQTVVPNEVRKRLGIKPGDRLRYDISDRGIAISKAEKSVEDDPFAVFTEWGGAADEEAYSKL